MNDERVNAIHADWARAVDEISRAVREVSSAMEDIQWPAPPSNERPWHKHTLPKRRRK